MTLIADSSHMVGLKIFEGVGWKFAVSYFNISQPNRAYIPTYLARYLRFGLLFVDPTC